MAVAFARNTLSHTSLVVQRFLTENNISVVPQPPYSPDPIPSEFWLFPTLKIGLEETCFAAVEEIEVDAAAEVQEIPRKAFYCCFPAVAGAMDLVCVRVRDLSRR